MNINIIAGNCSEICNEYIFSLLKKRDKSKNHVIISPDRCQFNIEKRLFDELGEKCFFDINVISLSRLSKTILKGNKKNILSKQSGVALVKKILKENKSNLSAFGKAVDYVGFASSLFETICFYKSCNITSEQVSVNDSRTFANFKQKDIKLVYSEYENYLKTDYTDSFNQLKLFADSIDINTFKDTIFYFVEFDDFTRLMYDIIIKLSKFSLGVYINCLYGKESNNSNIYNNKVYYDLVDIFKGEGLNYNVNKLIGFENVAKNDLSTNLLAYKPQNIDLSSSGITIKSFENIKDEIKFVLAEIYSKLIVDKACLSDFAIVVPSLNTYKKLLIEELGKYSMPYYIDESYLLSDNYMVRLMFDIAKIISGDYRLCDFSVVLKSSVLGYDKDAVCQFDNYLRRITAISDMCLCSNMTDNEDIKNFIDFIKSSREVLKEGCTYSNYVDLMTNVYNFIQSKSGTFVESLDVLDSRVFTQVNTKVNNINSDISSVFGLVEVKFEEFIDIYRAYFEATTISMPPITSDTLFVADFNNSYLTKYDYVYILGNNEGVLPSKKLDNGLITDDEIAKLPNAKKLTPTVAMLNARKVLKLYDLIFKYKKELNLSYVNGNFEGKLYPNNLIQSLVNIGDIEIKNYSYALDVLNNNFEELKENNIVFNNLTPKIARENLITYLYNWETYNSCIPYRELCSTLFDISDNDTKQLALSIGNYKVQLVDLTSNNFFKYGRTSVSQIETFNKCPYQHFIRYGLKLKDNENNSLKPNQIGTIIHEVLSMIIPIILKDKEDSNIQDKARMLLDKVLEKEEFKEMTESSNNIYVIKALYRELNRIIEAVVREIKLSNFQPIQTPEFKFENILNIAGVDIKGFIDRIDTKDDGFIIIDYKTGSNSFSDYNDVYSGKKLQLLVYAKAYEKISGLKAKGVFYFPISNKFGDDRSYRFNGVMLKDDANIVDMDTGLSTPNYISPVVSLQTVNESKIKSNNYYKNMCLTREDFDYLLDFAIEQVERSIVRIKAGAINPYPLCDGGKKECMYCDYKALCNYEDNNDHEVIKINTINELKEMSVQDE